MTDVDYLTMMKSTIVRSQKSPWFLPLLRAAHGALSALAPARAAKRAERLFTTPPRHRMPAAEVAALERARPGWVRADGRALRTWRWGHAPTVLLVHGWGGRGGQLAAFVTPLRAHGFGVVTFDAPGHGASEGDSATIPQMVVAIRAVAASHGPLAGLIAHSVGAAAAARALYEGLELGAAVFVAAVAELVESAERFIETLGFSPRVGELMRARIERRVGLPWSAFGVPELAPALKAPLLVAHDLGDAEIPWQHAQLIAQRWPGAELLLTDGLGHRRILSDPDVIAAAVSFLAARVAERSAGAITTCGDASAACSEVAAR